MLGKVLSKLVLPTVARDMKDETVQAPDAPTGSAEMVSRAVSHALFATHAGIPPLAVMVNTPQGTLTTEIVVPIPIAFQQSWRMFDMTTLRSDLSHIEELFKCTIDWPVVVSRPSASNSNVPHSIELVFRIRWEVSEKHHMRVRRYTAPKQVPPALNLAASSAAAAAAPSRVVKRSLSQMLVASSGPRDDGSVVHLQDAAGSDIADVATDICVGLEVYHGHPLYGNLRDRLEFSMDVLRRIVMAAAEDDGTPAKRGKTEKSDGPGVIRMHKMTRSGVTSAVPEVLFFETPMDRRVGASPLPLALPVVTGVGVFLDLSQCRWMCAISTGVDPLLDNARSLASLASQL